MKRFICCILVCVCLLFYRDAHADNGFSISYNSSGVTPCEPAPFYYNGVSYLECEAYYHPGSSSTHYFYYNPGHITGLPQYSEIPVLNSEGTQWTFGVDGFLEFSRLFNTQWDTVGKNQFFGANGFGVLVSDINEGLIFWPWLNSQNPSTYQLTVNLNPPAGGTVTSNPQSNFSCTNGVCTGNFSGNVALTASANSGNQFISWKENGTVINNNCPATILDLSINCARSITAEFIPVLKWPLTGTKSSRNEDWVFGSAWTYGECPAGTYKKHAGIDVNATAGEEVYAAHDGVIKKIFIDQHSQWADAIVIESTDGRFTTVYWHVLKYGNLSETDTVTKGQQIATIASLPNDNTHFHFGVRMSAYSNPESYAGALPVAGCGLYLAYPEKFLDPDLLTYE